MWKSMIGVWLFFEIEPSQLKGTLLTMIELRFLKIKGFKINKKYVLTNN